MSCDDVPRIAAKRVTHLADLPIRLNSAARRCERANISAPLATKAGAASLMQLT